MANVGLLAGLAVLHLVHNQKFPGTLVGLEVTVTSILAIEVCCRMYSKGRSFCHSWCNVLDAIIVILCLVSVVIFSLIPVAAELEEAMAEVLIICRYGVHFIRVLMLLKMTTLQHKRRGRIGSEWEVTFTPLGESESDVEAVIEMMNISADISDTFSDGSEKWDDDNEPLEIVRPETSTSQDSIEDVTLYDRYANLIIDHPHADQKKIDKPYRDKSPTNENSKSMGDALDGKTVGSNSSNVEDNVNFESWRRNSVIATVTISRNDEEASWDV